ncbi:hypothetical protein GCM10009654_60180 [Streptomyces hebeiensis]|uniref:Uncharacterized protein n=1 Tax=Streptomyces hebeiensis TaxID=229486 RepID=A0ABN1V882_9ACTN
MYALGALSVSGFDDEGAVRGTVEFIREDGARRRHSVLGQHGGEPGLVAACRDCFPGREPGGDAEVGQRPTEGDQAREFPLDSGEDAVRAGLRAQPEQSRAVFGVRAARSTVRVPAK